MAGTANWQIKINTNIQDVISQVEQLKKTDNTVKLNIDASKLDATIKELQNLSNAFGKQSFGSEQFNKLNKEFETIKKTVATLYSKVDDEALRTTTVENKHLEEQAKNTSVAIENEGKSAQFASEKFRKLAKEKGVATVANRELAKSAKEAANALEREAKAQEQVAKGNKGGKKKSSSSYSHSEMEQFIKETVEATKSVDELNTRYKVVLDNDGGLSITKSITEASGEVKTFTAKFDDVNTVINAAKNSATQFKAVLESGFNSGSMTSSRTGLFEDKVNGWNDKFAKYTASSTNFQFSGAYLKEIEELRVNLQEITLLKDRIKKSGNIMSATDADRVRDLSEQIEQSFRNLAKFNADGKGVNLLSAAKLKNHIGDYLEKNTKLTEEFRARLKALMDELDAPMSDTSIKKIATDFETVKGKAREAGLEGQRFLDRFKNSAISNGIYQLTTYFLSIYDIIRYLRQGFETVKEIDTAFTDMRKVSDEPLAVLKEYREESYDVADAIGTTGLQIQKSTADWMRLGRLQQKL